MVDIMGGYDSEKFKIYKQKILLGSIVTQDF